METAIRVLVVDDEDRFRENMVRLLNGQEGMRAQGAEDGPQALQALEKEEFDVVLLDMKMPDMDGRATFAEMQNMEADAQVVVLSGHASVNDAMEMMAQGVFDYLIKPCPLDTLVKKVRQAHLEKRMLRGEAGMDDLTRADI
ncbi:MAG: response regulator [Desulfovibrio sp.]|jgi:DNA-binding NtrC family response regulator|nr:response regulator [Desulfovibrio sp.]